MVAPIQKEKIQSIYFLQRYLHHPEPQQHEQHVDYYKWYYYWVKNGKNGGPPSNNHIYSEDYMLKTQIVPPVCPACSTSLGTCVNCSSGSGNTFSGGDSIFYNPWLNLYSKDKNIPQVSNAMTTSNNGNTIANTNSIDEDCDYCSVCSEEEETTFTTTNPTINNIQKQGQFQRKMVDEEKFDRQDFGKQDFGKQDFGKQDFGEEGDFEEEEFGEEEFGEEEFEEEEEEGGGEFGEEYGNSGNTIMDPYSYFNSVPSKGSNFVPILSDFSKFGR
jgi:hypothetical protein